MIDAVDNDDYRNLFNGGICMQGSPETHFEILWAHYPKIMNIYVDIYAALTWKGMIQ